MKRHLARPAKYVVARPAKYVVARLNFDLIFIASTAQIINVKSL